MNALLERLASLLTAHGVSASLAAALVTAAGVVGVILLAGLANYVAKKVILRSVQVVILRTHFRWDDAMLKAGVFTRLSHVAPAVVVQYFGPVVLGSSPQVLSGVRTAVAVYLVGIAIGVIYAIINAVLLIDGESDRVSGVPLKGFAQALKLVTSLVGGILILAFILQKSPVYLFSGLGALTAVLLLVFRDAILGFVAGIMISVNRLVRVGDWIEMPKAGADGDVIDVSLTTVKVRNWDKTITTIPTYTLISDSFKNWRGMQETGGRRIKRALLIDQSSVRFADEAMLDRWSRIGLLQEYLAERRREIAADHARLGEAATVLGNGRRLTNLGTFRAYCVAYLRAHPHISQELTFLVRQLAPNEHGLPLEIYVFVNNTNWSFYEGVQADIFDHLLAVIGEFDLQVYQQPAGRDVRVALGKALERAVPPRD